MTVQTQDETKGMAWWNGLSDEQRKEWMARAGNTGVAADAWAAFKTAAIKPIPEDFQGPESDLSDWQTGTDKPAIEGPYLREFAEGEAISTWCDGKWLRDGFFPSDIQDAPWRGIRA